MIFLAKRLEPHGITCTEAVEGSWSGWILLVGHGKRAILATRLMRGGCVLFPEPTDEYLAHLRAEPNDARHDDAHDDPTHSKGWVGYVDGEDVLRWFTLGEIPDNGYGQPWANPDDPAYDEARSDDPRNFRRTPRNAT